ncbi:hypothetical protein FCU26_1244 [Mycobacterium tuberculosis variant bovis]|nr:hypothetical protein FCU26_1244 [Mycobacterium tuberculosis variant bovis]
MAVRYCPSEIGRKHRRRRGPPDRLRRVRRPAGSCGLLAAWHPRGPAADPDRSPGLRRAPQYSSDWRRSARHRRLDAASVRNHLGVRRRSADHRRHARHRQDGRGGPVGRGPIHPGVRRRAARPGGRRRCPRRRRADARPGRD